MGQVFKSLKVYKSIIKSDNMESWTKSKSFPNNHHLLSTGAKTRPLLQKMIKSIVHFFHFLNKTHNLVQKYNLLKDRLIITKCKKIHVSYNFQMVKNYPLNFSLVVTVTDLKLNNYRKSQLMDGHINKKLLFVHWKFNNL